MNWCEVIKFSSLTGRQQWFLEPGDCYSISIDDERREIKMKIRLEPLQYKQFKDKELEGTSIGTFKRGKRREIFICKLNINIEEEK